MQGIEAVQASSTDHMRDYLASPHKSLSPPALTPEHLEFGKKVQSTDATISENVQQAPVGNQSLRELTTQTLERLIGKPDVAFELALHIVGKTDEDRQMTLWRRHFKGCPEISEHDL